MVMAVTMVAGLEREGVCVCVCVCVCMGWRACVGAYENTVPFTTATSTRGGREAAARYRRGL